VRKGSVGEERKRRQPKKLKNVRAARGWGGGGYQTESPLIVAIGLALGATNKRRKKKTPGKLGNSREAMTR